MIPFPHRSFGARLAIVASIVGMAGFLMAASFNSRLSPTGMCGSDGTVVIIDAELTTRRASQLRATRSVNLKAGTAYEVTLYSWDDHRGAADTQSNESWHIQLFSNGKPVYTSGYTPDIDEVDVKTWKGTTTFSAPPDKLVATHRSGTPSDEKGDSVWAVCAVFKDVGPPPPVNERPVITLEPPNPMTVTVGDTYDEPGFVATDKEDLNLTDKVVPTGIPSQPFKVGDTFTVRYNVEDSQNLAAVEKTRSVTIVAPPCTATSRPAITLEPPNPMTVTVGDTYDEPGYVATDTKDGNLTDKVVPTGLPGQPFEVGDRFTVTYNVEDSDGCRAIAKTRTVTAVQAPTCTPTSRPVITLEPGNPTATVGGSYSEPGYVATDTKDGNLTAKVTRTGLPSRPFKVGRYTIRYSVEDSDGCKAIQRTRTFTVVNKPVVACTSTSRPVITLEPGNPTATVGGSYDEPGYVATDTKDRNLTAKVKRTGLPSKPFEAGEYTIRYAVEDSDGCQAFAKTRNFTVNPEPPCAPVITLIGPELVTVNIDGEYRDWGATAVDGDQVISASIVSSGLPVLTSILGTHSVTYRVSSDCGVTEKTRTVIVHRVIPPDSWPVITLIGPNVIEVTQNSAYIDPGAIVIDDEDGNISSNITSDITPGGSVDTATLGTYIVTYRVEDSAHHSADPRTRIVRVVADPEPDPDEKPVITLIGPNVIEVTQDSIYIDPGATAMDEEDGDISADITPGGSVDTATLGTYIVTYRVKDSARHSADPRTRRVSVVAEIPDDEVLLEAKVFVTLTDNEDVEGPFSAGVELVYTVRFVNLGTADATVSATLELPRGVSHPDDGECAALVCTTERVVPAEGELDPPWTVSVVLGDDAAPAIVATVTVEGDGVVRSTDHEPTVLRSDD